VPTPKLIPVLDIRCGVVVHAVAGKRAQYRAIRSRLTSSTQPGEVAAALLHTTRSDTIYIADLDAISGGAVQPLPRVADGITVWHDAGGADLTLPHVVPIRPSECGYDPRTATACCIVGVDLRAGALVGWPGPPADYVGLAYERGARRFLVLDTCTVGTHSGPSTLELCAALRGMFGDITLITGGGIRHPADVLACGQAGVDAVLVATALHTGALP